MRIALNCWLVCSRRGLQLELRSYLTGLQSFSDSRTVGHDTMAVIVGHQFFISKIHW